MDDWVQGSPSAPLEVDLSQAAEMPRGVVRRPSRPHATPGPNVTAQNFEMGDIKIPAKRVCAMTIGSRGDVSGGGVYAKADLTSSAGATLHRAAHANQELQAGAHRNAIFRASGALNHGCRQSCLRSSLHIPNARGSAPHARAISDGVPLRQGLGRVVRLGAPQYRRRPRSAHAGPSHARPRPELVDIEQVSVDHRIFSRAPLVRYVFSSLNRIQSTRSSASRSGSRTC
jgi:hypothetical protein